VFHRIYESMGLGMHPTSLYPRRSRVAPIEMRWPRKVVVFSTLYSTGQVNACQIVLTLELVCCETLDGPWRGADNPIPAGLVRPMTGELIWSWAMTWLIAELSRDSCVRSHFDRSSPLRGLRCSTLTLAPITSGALTFALQAWLPRCDTGPSNK
jgi:hypothetical protein